MSNTNSNNSVNNNNNQVTNENTENNAASLVDEKIDFDHYNDIVLTDEKTDDTNDNNISFEDEKVEELVLLTKSNDQNENKDTHMHESNDIIINKTGRKQIRINVMDEFKDHVQYMIDSTRNSNMFTNVDQDDTPVDNVNRKIQLSKEEKKYFKRYNCYELAVIFEKYNGGIVKSYKKTNKKLHYIWNDVSKLWEKDCTQSKKLRRIVVQTLNKIAYNSLSKKRYNKFRSSMCNPTLCSNILYFIDIPIDHNFIANVDVDENYYPLRNGKKINLHTKKISSRTKFDYWTFEPPADYIKDLSPADNIMDQFLFKIFDIYSEKVFITKLLGYLLSAKCHLNIIALFCHKLGGSGKTILIDILTEAFPNSTVCIDRNLFFGNKKINEGAELCKIGKHRLMYVDEATKHKTKNKKKKKIDDEEDDINVGNLCAITGGGTIAPRDAHQAGSTVQQIKIRAKLVLLGNDTSFTSSTHSAINRRIIFIPIQTYFRDEADINYNVNDIHCKKKDNNIRTTLSNALNHVVTYGINAMHEFIKLQKNEQDLVNKQPIRFKNEWLQTCCVQTVFNNFINEHFIQQPRVYEELKDVMKHFKQFGIHYFTYNNVEQYIQEYNNMHEDITNIVLSNCVINDEPKSRKIKGLKLKSSICGLPVLSNNFNE